LLLQCKPVFLHPSKERKVKTKIRNYSGWKIDQSALLSELEKQGIVPKHAVLYAEHVTNKYPDSVPAPEVGNIRVVDYHSSDDIDCVTVEVDGTSVRADGSVYHITVSAREGVRPVKSNELLRQIVGRESVLLRVFELGTEPF